MGSTSMPGLLPIILTASHIVLAADGPPKFDVERTSAGPPPLRAFCRGATGPRVNVTKTTRATSSSGNGPDTALYSVSTARAPPRSTVRRATLNY